jgi:hypothetical protein
VQNSDDAGSRFVRFIYDKRQVPFALFALPVPLSLLTLPLPLPLLTLSPFCHVTID